MDEEVLTKEASRMENRNKMEEVAKETRRRNRERRGQKMPLEMQDRVRGKIDDNAKDATMKGGKVLGAGWTIRDVDEEDEPVEAMEVEKKTAFKTASHAASPPRMQPASLDLLLFPLVLRPASSPALQPTSSVIQPTSSPFLQPASHSPRQLDPTREDQQRVIPFVRLDSYQDTASQEMNKRIIPLVRKNDKQCNDIEQSQNRRVVPLVRLYSEDASPTYTSQKRGSDYLTPPSREEHDIDTQKYIKKAKLDPTGKGYRVQQTTEGKEKDDMVHWIMRKGSDRGLVFDPAVGSELHRLTPRSKTKIRPLRQVAEGYRQIIEPEHKRLVIPLVPLKGKESDMIPLIRITEPDGTDLKESRDVILLGSVKFRWVKKDAKEEEDALVFL